MRNMTKKKQSAAKDPRISCRQWLEVLERDENGRAQKLKLIRYAATKEELNDYLINDADDWDWNTNYIFVYSDPEQQCELY